MASKAFVGKFATVFVNISGYKRIGEVRDIGEIPMSRTLLDATYHDKSIWPERVPGLAEAPDIDLEVNVIETWTDTTVTPNVEYKGWEYLHGLWETQEKNLFKIELYESIEASPKTWTFSFWAYVSRVSITANIEDVVTAAVRLGTTGVIEFDAPTVIL